MLGHPEWPLRRLIHRRKKYRPTGIGFQKYPKRDIKRILKVFFTGKSLLYNPKARNPRKRYFWGLGFYAASAYSVSNNAMV
jgi:hypothetical protein